MKTFYATLVISIILIIGGFFCPPIGVIDGSVLTAVGLLLVFAITAMLPKIIATGRAVKISKGDVELRIEN